MIIRYNSIFLGVLLTGLLLLYNGQVFTQPIEVSKVGPDVTFHFQPEESVFGDPIPFYHDGIHHVFYLNLQKKLDGTLSGHQWSHLASHDLVIWEQWPTAIKPDEEESFIATGNIVEDDGTFYAFYCTAIASEDTREPVICVATSHDLIHWKKSTSNPLIRLYHDVPTDVYETKKDWRDPHVFWNPEVKQWWMAISAKERTDGVYSPSGAVALATSSDLLNWKVQRKPLLLDRDSNAGECPDIFPFGEGWAMIYYPDATRIRLAKSPQGPWRRPTNDAPNGLHFNAGKTEFDNNRYIWHGYLARLSHDYDKHQYGGVMALPRELYLDKEGNPAVRLLSEIIEACNRDATSGQGGKVFDQLLKSSVHSSINSITLDPGVGEHALAIWKDAPADFFLSSDVTLGTGGQLTLYFRSTQEMDDSYILRIDACNSEVSLHHWTGWNRRSAMNTRSMVIPETRSFKLHIMLHGDVFEAFLDDRIAISSRFQIPEGSLAISSRDAMAELNNLKITYLPEP
jgi:sucrose-6-phosphate hydrolase SacC (GH32 family)